MVDKRISELDPAGPLTGNELVELVQDVGGQLDSVQSPLQDIVQQLALQGPPGPQGNQGPAGPTGTEGEAGWSPVLAVVNDGTRRVLQLTNWTGGAGTAPPSGKYIGAAGLVDAIADAVDVRGSQGAQGVQGQPGAQGPQGNPGAAGADGDDGWSPVFAIVNDGPRRVLQVTGWTGGTGTPPATGKYVGATGLVDAIADAVDVRGPQGAQGLPGAPGEPGTAGDPGAAGQDGDDGWSPEFAVVADGARRVLEISSWTGGSGGSPASGQFVGAAGLVDDIADAVDVRGPQGAQGSVGPQGTQGPQGPQGNPGTVGADGDDGWSPQLALISDGARRVLKISGWTGGSGTPPASDLYIGVSGLVSDIADAIDVRGAAGAAGTNGSNGATWRSGTGAPSAALGADGDFYFRTDTDDVYQKAAGAYSVIANIKGSAGVNGTNGTNGTNGQGVPTGGTAAQALTKVNNADYNTQWTTIDKAFVGLGNVNNTADADKPVSSATQTALDAKSAITRTINTQTDNYTLALTDAGNIVEMNTATAKTLTVPPNSSVAFAIGTQIDLAQLGAGQTTVAAGSGVTIRSSGGKLKLTGQYSGGTLYKRATNEWVLLGDIAA